MFLIVSTMAPFKCKAMKQTKAQKTSRQNKKNQSIDSFVREFVIPTIKKIQEINYDREGPYLTSKSQNESGKHSKTPQITLGELFKDHKNLIRLYQRAFPKKSAVLQEKNKVLSQYLNAKATFPFEEAGTSIYYRLIRILIEISDDFASIKLVRLKTIDLKKQSKALRATIDIKEQLTFPHATNLSIEKMELLKQIDEVISKYKLLNFLTPHHSKDFSLKEKTFLLRIYAHTYNCLLIFLLKTPYQKRDSRSKRKKTTPYQKRDSGIKWKKITPCPIKNTSPHQVKMQKDRIKNLMNDTQASYKYNEIFLKKKKNSSTETISENAKQYLIGSTESLNTKSLYVNTETYPKKKDPMDSYLYRGDKTLYHISKDSSAELRTKIESHVKKYYDKKYKEISELKLWSWIW